MKRGADKRARFEAEIDIGFVGENESNDFDVVCIDRNVKTGSSNLIERIDVL